MEKLTTTIEMERATKEKLDNIWNKKETKTWNDEESEILAAITEKSDVNEEDSEGIVPGD